jgi:hypothetical protein
MQDNQTIRSEEKEQLVVRRRTLLFGFAAALVGRSAHARAGTTMPLFVITRSKNANEIHYEARLTQNGQLDPKEPIVAYWLMLAEDGRREGLTSLERELAYGWTAQAERQGDGIRLRMRAFSQREIRVARDEMGVFRPTLSIAGRRATLSKIHVAADERGPKPSVRFVDLFGVDVASRKPVKERVAP